MAAHVVVPDASVILKWVLPSDDEPDADKALILRDAILDDTVQVILPSLWLYEVGNTVARRFPTHAQTWLSALVRFGLEEALPTTAWLNKTVELVSRYEVSFYDASYHALAILHKGLFISADKRYVTRTVKSGSVVTLNEWRPPIPSAPRGPSQ